MAEFTKTVTLPTSGQTATIRRLNWKQLRDAERAQTRESIEMMKEIGADLIAAFRSDTKPDAADRAADQIERLQKAERRKPSKYDMEKVLSSGVVSIQGDDLNIESLGPLDAEALHEAIVAYCWEGQEAKNASASSTGSLTAIPE